MITLFIEGGGDYTGVVIMFLVIMLLPAIILTLIGLGIKKTKPKTSKVLFIISVIYTIISLGACGAMMN
ncbi:hypothetical protein [Lacinutrix chionoecetis]